MLTCPSARPWLLTSVRFLLCACRCTGRASQQSLVTIFFIIISWFVSWYFHNARRLFPVSVHRRELGCPGARCPGARRTSTKTNKKQLFRRVVVVVAFSVVARRRVALSFCCHYVARLLTTCVMCHWRKGIANVSARSFWLTPSSDLKKTKSRFWGFSSESLLNHWFWRRRPQKMFF